jgi:glycine dehydrogenase
VAAAKAAGINLWRVDADHVSVACDEATTDAHVTAVLAAFGVDGCTVEATGSDDRHPHLGVPDPSGVPPVPHRDLDDAVPAALADKDIALDAA